MALRGSRQSRSNQDGRDSRRGSSGRGESGRGSSRRSDLTPQFEYDAEAGQYRYASGPNAGRAVSRLKVREVLDGVIEKQNAKVRILAEQMRAREISLPDFQKEMERSVAKIHLASAAAARGGWHNMTPIQYKGAQELVGRELGGEPGVHGGLRGMCREIENGLPLDGRFLQRVTQYSEAGRHTYHVFETLEMNERGMNEQRFVRHAQDSCDECVMLAALGWHEIGSTKEPGERICLRRCKCGKEYRVGAVAERPIAAEVLEKQAIELEPGSETERLPKRRLFTQLEIARQKALELKAINELGLERADFSGFDPDVAAQIIDQVAEYFEKFPAVRAKVKFLGGEETARRNYFASESTLAQIKRIKQNHDDLSLEEVTELLIKKWEKEHEKFIGMYSPYDGVQGIYFRESWAQDKNAIKRVMEEGVLYGNFAPGHESLKGLIDHEMGHALDDLIKLRDNPEIKAVFKEFLRLSEDHKLEELSYLPRPKVEEYIAQAWSEYINSSPPRIRALEIGRMMQERYNEFTGGE